jgi:hypothetical protein
MKKILLKNVLLIFITTIFFLISCDSSNNKGKDKITFDNQFNVRDTSISKVYTNYSDITHRDFIYRINDSLIYKSEIVDLIYHLNQQVDNLYSLLSKNQLKIVSRNPIWIENDRKAIVPIWYHISLEWLKDHNMNPDKVKCVEILNFSEYLKRVKTNQPFLLLHNLAHSYHDSELTFSYPAIMEAYDNAVSKGMYKNVSYLIGDGKYVDSIKAYASNDYLIYFSELSEAYFGNNDYYPHNREQLKEYDPIGYRVIKEAWEVRK